MNEINVFYNQICFVQRSIDKDLIYSILVLDVYSIICIGLVGCPSYHRSLFSQQQCQKSNCKNGGFAICQFAGCWFAGLPVWAWFASLRIARLPDLDCKKFSKKPFLIE